MTGFVFKIQANIDPITRPHRLHARLLGRLQRGMRAKLVRTGKPVTLSAPQFFFAQDRSLAEEAFSGDVVGIPNHGLLRIGDTLSEGEEIIFRGVPSFAPEILRRVKLADAMKAKKLREALQQMAEEGVVQVFLPHDGAAAIVGVVGALQLDCSPSGSTPNRNARDLRAEPLRDLPLGLSPDKAEMDKFLDAYPSSIASDLDGAPVFMASSAFNLRYEQERWPKIAFTDVKDYQKAAA